jgi:hypothetical protein
MADESLRLSTWKQVSGDLNFEEPDRWFVGDHCNRYPQGRPITADDILYGWLPARKLIKSGTKVLAFGSCFAEYFIKFLAHHGYNRWSLPREKYGLCEESLLLSLGQTFENIFVILQQLRWAFGEFTPRTALWFTKDKAYFEATEERRENIRSSFQQVDVLVVTLGMSEVWYDKTVNEPMWRPIPSRLYDPARHAFRRATVDETVTALGELDRTVRTFLPEKQVIFTVSPVPLIATFRDQSPVTANEASKSVLRAAMDEFFSIEEIRNRGCYHYFPSYELARHLFHNPFLPDNRHVRPEVVETIIRVFSAAYTDLPQLPDNPPEDRAHFLERRIRELEQELTQKEDVIRELDAAARERLAIIQKWLPGAQRTQATERAE